MKHPAHIHGIIGITPDRSNPHSGVDTTLSANSRARLGAVEDGYELLPTLSGAVKPANKVVFTLGIPEDLHLPLRDTRALVVFPPVDRRTEIGALEHRKMGLEYLSLPTRRHHLGTIKDSDALLHLDAKPRIVLLNYDLSNS